MNSTQTVNPPQAAEKMRELLEVISRLRGENGCPWDKEQTLSTLKPFLIEEAYELFDVMDSNDTLAHKEELGDVLLQVLLQAQIRNEEQAFSFEDVAETLASKLIRRHPHVFGETIAESAEAVIKNWEQIKQNERKVNGKDKSILHGIPRSLPALHKAERVQARAARHGFDWEQVHDVMLKVQEELTEVQEAMAENNADAIREEIGDLLFSIVNLCRFVDTRPEDALHATVEKFTRRFSSVEKMLQAKGRVLQECSLEEMDDAWNQVKRTEK